MKKKDMEDEFKNFIDPVFALGDVVYLKTDTLQVPRIVLGFYVSKGNIVKYELRSVDECGIYEDFEISKDKNLELSNEFEYA